MILKFIFIVSPVSMSSNSLTANGGVAPDSSIADGCAPELRAVKPEAKPLVECWFRWAMSAIVRGIVAFFLGLSVSWFSFRPKSKKIHGEVDLVTEIETNTPSYSDDTCNGVIKSIPHGTSYVRYKVLSGWNKQLSDRVWRVEQTEEGRKRAAERARVDNILRRKYGSIKNKMSRRKQCSIRIIDSRP
jgi:hypothetical protein